MDPNNKPQKKKCFLSLAFSLFLSTVLIFLSVSVSTNPFSHFNPAAQRVVAPETPRFVESKLHVSPTSTDPVPIIAYLISGSMGDGHSLKRTLKALYHPRNQYVVHLDLEASEEERLELANFVRDEPMFARFRNVRMIVKANLVTYRGPTMVTNTLHAAAILLREGGDWDWFINLSASDYPLVTQDGTRREKRRVWREKARSSEKGRVFCRSRGHGESSEKGRVLREKLKESLRRGQALEYMKKLKEKRGRAASGQNQFFDSKPRFWPNK